MASHAKCLAHEAMLLALALICAYLEFLFPLSLGIPGIKLGLANLVIVYALYADGAGVALRVSLCRVLLSALLFGNLSMGLYSLAGAMASLLVMIGLYRRPYFSLWGVSLAGGAVHNIAQVLLAACISGTPQILYYLILLIPVGMFTGLLIAFLTFSVRRALYPARQTIGKGGSGG